MACRGPRRDVERALDLIVLDQQGELAVEEELDPAAGAALR